jgi:hypothetical protein
MIRIGSKEDSYAIASLMLLAMEGLVKKFRGTEERLELIALLERFIKFPGNQYSYDNVIVDVTEERIAGVLIAYDGGAIEALRQPFFDFIIENYHPNGFAMDLEKCLVIKKSAYWLTLKI